MSKKMHHIVPITSMANNEIISKILFQEIIMRSCFIPFLYTLNDELCSFLLIIFQEHNLSCRELHLMHIITLINLCYNFFLSNAYYSFLIIRKSQEYLENEMV